MRAPIQSHPAYKKRLITAMLDETVLREISRPVAKSNPIWSVRFFCAVVGLALMSGVGMFLFLYHHDLSANSSVRVVESAGGEQPAVHQAAGTEAQTALSPAHALTSPDHEVAGPLSVDFKLKRSRNYQTIGPVGLRLLRVNTRRRTCDLSMRLNDRRTMQKRLQLNKPFELRPAKSTEPLQLSISTIGRDSVVGSLSALPGSSSAVKQ